VFEFSSTGDSEVLRFGMGIKETFLPSTSSAVSITQHWGWS